MPQQAARAKVIAKRVHKPMSEDTGQAFGFSIIGF